MPTIELGSPPPVATPAGPLPNLPRRTTLTLSELRLVADLADTVLPFDPTRPGTDPGAAYEQALAGLPDPHESLARRGLLRDAGLDGGLREVARLLAAAHLALDLDVAVAETQVRAWHRRRYGSVATLATADGLVFELTRCSVAQWTDELSRVAVLPAETTEATRGRLRAVVTDLTGETTAVVGVVSWLLVADGWRALQPRRTGGDDRAHLVAVEPADLPLQLAPALAETAR